MVYQTQKKRRVAILGKGFVGHALFQDLSVHYDVICTSRKGTIDASGNIENPIKFELRSRETWDTIFPSDFIVWTFPSASTVEDIALAEDFFRQVKNKAIPTLVMASTSCYLPVNRDSLVDENCTLDWNQPRVQAEEILRKEGCFLLVLAGIYGLNRDPARWLEQGLIKNGNQYINLIHISDILGIVRAWLLKPLSGLRLNASDGRHRRWHEVLTNLKEHKIVGNELQPFTGLAAGTNSKRVSNTALVEQLYSGPFHRYPEHGL